MGWPKAIYRCAQYSVIRIEILEADMCMPFCAEPPCKIEEIPDVDAVVISVRFVSFCFKGVSVTHTSFCYLSLLLAQPL